MKKTGQVPAGTPPMAMMAGSVKSIPHNGVFHECNNIHAEGYRLTSGRHAVHLVIRKAHVRGSYVLRLTPEAALLIAEDLMARAKEMQAHALGAAAIDTAAKKS